MKKISSKKKPSKFMMNNPQTKKSQFRLSNFFNKNKL